MLLFERYHQGVANAKKQHTVPQAPLLAAFATAPKGKLFVFDKRTSRIWPSRARDAACQTGFYEYIDDDGRGRSLEPVLASLEGEVAPLFNRIRASNNLCSIAPQEWASIDWFVVVQILRTSQGKNELANIAAALRDARKKFPPGSDMWFLARTTGQQSASTTFEIIRDRHPLFTGALADKARLLLKTVASNEFFYLSDNPVVFRNQHGFALGSAQPGIEIYLPLSPELTLSYICPYLAAVVHEPHFRNAMATGEPFPLSEKDVAKLNELQVRSASRFVYSCSDSLEVARRLLDAEPALANSPEIKVFEKKIRIR